MNAKSVKASSRSYRVLMISLPPSVKSVEEDLKDSSLFPLFI